MEHPSSRPSPLWFHEKVDGLATGFAIESVVARHQSPYQEIVIYETTEYGRMMALDGCVMLTERDEFLYHELLVHPAMCCHDTATRALVIGGGDGGTVRELLRYEQLESIDLVELDEAVVQLSKAHLPGLSVGLDDPRVTLRFEDGVAFLRAHRDAYDIILVDSTDPVGPAAGLITKDFYGLCHQALRPDGILALQSESPIAHLDAVKTIVSNVRTKFAHAALYHGPVVTYPSGWWSFVWASPSRRHTQLDEAKAQRIAAGLHYYNPAMHHAIFALPNFLQNALQPEGTP